MNKLHVDVPQTKAVLADIELFAELGDEALEKLCEVAEMIRVSCGEFLIRKGDHADCMYVVVRGQVRILDISDSENDIKYGPKVGPGQTVGELALLIDSVRSASVQACRDCLLLRISRSQFDEIMSQWPGVSLGVSRLLARRITERERVSQNHSRISTLALIPGRDPEAFRTFVEQLRATLAEEGPVRHLSSESAAQLASESDIGERDACWLHSIESQETEFRFTILEADPARTSWSEFCVRQSDQVLLVHDHSDSRELSDTEKFIFESKMDFQTQVSVDLYLLHQSGSKDAIVGTCEWLTHRPVYRHHHVFLDRADDFQRARRFLTGKAVGLVIGGGGSLGGYALGVFRALRDSGVPIDMVGGNSAGSVVAGLIATGHTDAQVMSKKLAYFVKNLTNIFSYTLPIFGLLRRAKNNKIFTRLFGEKQIEDLPISCFTVGTNLSTGRGVSVRSGPLWRACRISTCLPGISQPFVQDGELLFDGALVVNLPSEAMAEKCDGRIILIDLIGDEDFTIEGGLPSPWRVFWSKLNPFARRIDTLYLLDIAFRAVCISNLNEARDAAYRRADFTFTMPANELRGSAYRDVGPALEMGYTHAKEQLGLPFWDEWQESSASSQDDGEHVQELAS